jgi:hypothetical protein
MSLGAQFRGQISFSLLDWSDSNASFSQPLKKLKSANHGQHARNACDARNLVSRIADSVSCSSNSAVRHLMLMYSSTSKSGKIPVKFRIHEDAETFFPKFD